MKIEVLGTGCPKCKIVEENARKAVAESGAKVELIKVTEIGKIIEYGVMSTPALVIDGVVKASGRIPETKEIVSWIKKK